MYKFIIFFCIFSNFWGSFYLFSIGWGEDVYIVPPNKYYLETLFELFGVSLFLLYLGICFFKVNRKEYTFKCKIKNKKFLFCIYLFLLFVVLSSTNFSLDNALRGVGQADLANRGGVNGFMSAVSFLVIPFVIFLQLSKPFEKYNSMYIGILLASVLIQSVSIGGRRMIVYVLLIVVLYIYYYKGISIKRMTLYSLPIVILLPFAIIMRNYDAYMAAPEDIGIIDLLYSSILQVNSDPSFLWAVKDFISKGYNLSPITFFFHFTSVFMPNFIYVVLFDRIGYERSVFYFDDLFNSNPNQGYDFMMLADFYWCWGCLGYVLYVIFVAWSMAFFSRNIYSPRLYKVVGAFMTVILVCQQRNDFGAFIKPLIYSILFVYILEKLFIVYNRGNTVLTCNKNS